MHFSLLSLLSTLLCLSLALASPSPGGNPPKPGHGRGNKHCLSPKDVRTLTDAYTRLIASFSHDDARFLSEDFAEYSDSINALANQPLGRPAFASKEAFLAAQETNPALPLEVEDVNATTCDRIVLTWSATFGVGLPVRGVTVLRAVWGREGRGPKRWRIKEINVEFNGLAFAVNSGGAFEFQGKRFHAGDVGNLRG